MKIALDDFAVLPAPTGVLGCTAICDGPAVYDAVHTGVLLGVELVVKELFVQASQKHFQSVKNPSQIFRCGEKA